MAIESSCTSGPSLKPTRISMSALGQSPSSWIRSCLMLFPHLIELTRHWKKINETPFTWMAWWMVETVWTHAGYMASRRRRGLPAWQRARLAKAPGLASLAMREQAGDVQVIVSSPCGLGHGTDPPCRLACTCGFSASDCPQGGGDRRFVAWWAMHAHKNGPDLRRLSFIFPWA